MNGSTDQRNDREVVLCIHGTFAAHEGDTGDKWWQIGSTFRQTLDQRIGPRAASVDTFHWSGSNSRNERFLAAADLFENHLKPLEKKKTPFHLIGHSHGGGVIFEALKLATIHKLDLAHLKSWSTVGTPFIHHRNSIFPHRQLFSALTIGIFAMASLILFIFAYMFVAMWLTEPDFQLFDILRFFFIGDAEVGPIFYDRDFALAALAMPALFVAFILIITIFGLFWGDRWRTIPTMHKYGARWLGLYSVHDEAIGALQATVVSHRQSGFVPRLAAPFDDVRRKVLSPKAKASKSERVAAILYVYLNPLYWLLAFLASIYNRLFCPIADRWVWGMLMAKAQGNDQDGAVFGVSAVPVATNAHQYPSLPQQIDDTICAEANEHLKNSTLALRRILAEAAIGGADLLAGVFRGIALKEMVHTSYFDNPEVGELLALHILSTEDPQVLQHSSLGRWVMHAKEEAEKLAAGV